jgi:hypothetical protein
MKDIVVCYSVNVTTHDKYNGHWDDYTVYYKTFADAKRAYVEVIAVNKSIGITTEVVIAPMIADCNGLLEVSEDPTDYYDVDDGLWMSERHLS